MSCLVRHSACRPALPVQLPNDYLRKVKAFIQRVMTAGAKIESEPHERKKQEAALRDLKPEKDATGGRSNGGCDRNPGSTRTGEMDFMNDTE